MHGVQMQAPGAGPREVEVMVAAVMAMVGAWVQETLAATAEREGELQARTKEHREA